MMNGDDVMKAPGAINERDKRARRTVQLVVTLLLFVAVIYAMTFLKLPVWLPALK
jgi:hypothetical protein